MEETSNVGETISTVSDVVVNDTKTYLHLDELKAYFTWANLVHLIIAFATIVIFVIVYHIIRRFVIKRATRKLKPASAQMVNKGVKYTFYVLISMYILGLFGVDLTAIWGAAGVAGVAIGFAAQTSVSNLISGMIVLAEKSLQVGDFIALDDVMGTVDSVGLLCVNIHTLDNQFVRIPSSSILSSNLINYSHFPIRRFTFDFPIDYDADLAEALEAVKTIPARCPTVLQEPEPLVYYDGLGDDGMDLKLCVWFKGSDLIQTKNDVYINIINVCDELGLDIPYTHMEINLHNEDEDVKKLVKKVLYDKNVDLSDRYRKTTRIARPENKRPGDVKE